MNSVSVFVPESSLGTTALSQPDLLQALHLPVNSSSGSDFNVLELCVSKLSRQVLPALVDAGNQTETRVGNIREDLGKMAYENWNMRQLV